MHAYNYMRYQKCDSCGHEERPERAEAYGLQSNASTILSARSYYCPPNPGFFADKVRTGSTEGDKTCTTCGQHVPMNRALMSCPPMMMITMAWAQRSTVDPPPRATVAHMAGIIQEHISINKLFETQTETVGEMRGKLMGVIGFYTGHYVTTWRSGAGQEWTMFNDARVSIFARSFDELKHRYRRTRPCHPTSRRPAETARRAKRPPSVDSGQTR